MEVKKMLAELGVLILCCVFAYWFYHIARSQKMEADREQNLFILEEMAMKKYATKKGIDMDKELMKKAIFQQKKKNFRKRIEEEIYDDLFGKGK